MLTRNTQCQLSASVSSPPISTPTVPPPAITKPNTPIALARSASSVNSSMISDSATADTTAPPNPWIARAAISSVCEAAGERRQGEEHDPVQEHPAMAVEIAQPPAQQQEAAIGQQVGIHHPHQRGLGKTEVAADRGQRHIHHGRIEHDHQVAQAQDAEGDPAALAVKIRGHSGLSSVTRNLRWVTAVDSTTFTLCSGSDPTSSNSRSPPPSNRCARWR